MSYTFWTNQSYDLVLIEQILFVFWMEDELQLSSFEPDKPAKLFKMPIEIYLKN